MKIILGNTVYVWLDEPVYSASEGWNKLADEVHKEAIVFDDGIIVGVEQ